MNESIYDSERRKDKWGYFLRKCLFCGKEEGKHWVRHWDRYHKGSDPRECLNGQQPIGGYVLPKDGKFKKGKGKRFNCAQIEADAAAQIEEENNNDDYINTYPTLFDINLKEDS